jgi:cell division transport system permease protein
MQATELQPRVDALEIAVSDAGLSSAQTSEHEAVVRVLPSWQSPEHAPVLVLAPEQDWDCELDELESDEFESDDDDTLLEPSDLLEVEAARTGAGLPSLSNLDALGELEHEFADELDDEPRMLADELAADAAGHVAVPLATDHLAVPLAADFDFDFDDNPIVFDEPSFELVEPSIATDEPAFELSPRSFEPELEHEPETSPATELPADPIRAPLWRGLNMSVYVFARGLRGMSQSPLVQLLAIGTMAVCMLLLGTTMLIFANASRVAHDLGVDTPVTVFMQPDVDPATATALRERIAALPEVARAERVSPEQALARLQHGAGETGERAELLAGIDPGVLPESVEIEFVAGVAPGFADALATRVQGMDGVEEVAVLGPWVQEVERMMTSLRALAIGVALLVSLACLAIVWSTIRLGVFARRSEIQLLRLVGGTARFVRGPFVVEGVVQGVLGTALALTGLWLAFELIRPLLERGMSLLFAAGSLQFFSSVEMIVAIGFGALLGLIGSRAAVARHAEA